MKDTTALGAALIALTISFYNVAMLHIEVRDLEALIADMQHVQAQHVDLTSEITAELKVLRASFRATLDVLREQGVEVD